MLPDVLIKDVSVELTINKPISEASLQITGEVKASSIGQKEIGYCYVILTYDAEAKAFPVAVLQAKMVFTVVEFDPNTKVEEKPYADEFFLPDVAVSAKDYITGKTLTESEFK